MWLPVWRLTAGMPRAAVMLWKECVVPRRLGIAVDSILSAPTAGSLATDCSHAQRRQDARAQILRTAVSGTAPTALF
eukprot:CAMPEP_0115861716 /NCGR_PEP_ID=MMETSP0287-20121206/17798_1 /TAXON_ID=412157 /ORGANISM="Chrysochromulina rotalis, Strain UIO044" /LENGTH=76 /DNA_ID=CAMNT_0003316103 /DNA_START=423 /DNA_END=650 /DNA_ORIENTATION=-